MSPADQEPARPNPFYLQDDPPAPSFLRRKFLAVMGLLAALPAFGQQKPKGGGGGGKKKGGDTSKASGPVFHGEYVLPKELAEYAKVSLILGRATDKSVVASVLSAEGTEGFLEVGTAAGRYTRKTPVTAFPSGQVVEIPLEGLAPGTEHFYRLSYRKPGAGSFTARAEQRFSTAKPPGKAFVFTVQGDSHPERPQSSHPDLYARTLQAAAADKPDFHICIGDDFSVDKVRDVKPASLAEPYLLQRPFLGLIGQAAPVFLCNGNHEQGSLFNFMQKDERHDVAVGVQLARNRLYPLPAPEGFYSGHATPFPGIGTLKSYCAWTWGDALFVLLDNYWHSPGLVDSGFQGGSKGKEGRAEKEGKNRDSWGVTLGDDQYRWFKRVLEASKARHKFVFAHHVMGSGRGAVEVASTYEWGGEGRKGEGTFKEKRPGWDLPIHQLMVKHKVSVFFQGHDHLYCQQEKDGVIYQSLPMPSDHGYVAYNADRYLSGVKHPSAGHLRVAVSAERVKVEYVRSFLPKDEGPDRKQGMVAHAYEVKSRVS
ncbi:MAG: metallophosphoesterase family protein [Opitutia bacterium]